MNLRSYLYAQSPGKRAIALANMRENCKRDLPWFVGQPAHRNSIVIVGGGPSVRSRLGAIRTRQKNGAYVVALNGAAKFLKANGITPNMIAFVDYSPVVCGFLDGTDCEYLVASVCHPSVFDALKDKRVIVWHPDVDDFEQVKISNLYPHKPFVTTGGGGMIGVRMPTLAYLFGYRSLHIYGLDSSYADDGADHAYTKHDGVEPEARTVTIDGKTYRCSPWMIRQSDEFRDVYQMLRARGCRIHVHGDGLIPDIWKAMNVAVRSKAA